MERPRVKALLTFLLRDPFLFLDAMADILAACVKQTCISDPRHLEEKKTQKEEGGTRREAAEVTQEMPPEATREVTPEAAPPSVLLPGKEAVSRISLVAIRRACKSYSRRQSNFKGVTALLLQHCLRYVLYGQNVRAYALCVASTSAQQLQQASPFLFCFLVTDLQ